MILRSGLDHAGRATGPRVPDAASANVTALTSREMS